MQRPRKPLDSAPRAIQGNFDHLQSFITEVARKLNLVVDDLDVIQEVLEGNLDVTTQSMTTIKSIGGSSHAENHLFWGPDHTDVNSADTPVTGEVPTWDGALWQSMSPGVLNLDGGKASSNYGGTTGINGGSA